jgi:DNA-binding SARP family transcriptional activator
MQTFIRVYTLGRFAIERDGQVLDNFLSTKTGILFTYLAMNPGEHARDRLAALFWSETNDEQSLKNLRTVLSSLRRQLDDTLVISRKTLAIRDDAAVWVDASAFERACEQGFSAVGTLNPFQEMRDLAAIYQGPFLSAVKIRDADTLDEWISVQQNRLAQLHRELLAGIVERAIEQARYPVGLQTVRDLISLDPLWETPRRQLMRLLAASDRLSEALVQYELFAQLLRDELNVAPDGETTRLYDQLKAGTTVSPPRTTASSIASPDMLFVEPAEDVEFAQRMLNSPQCRLLTIYGISGIGKTALAAQIAFHRQNRYRDGACFISLTPVQHPSNLPLALARALRIEVLASAPPQHDRGKRRRLPART